MSAFPPHVTHELEGWLLWWADLSLERGHEGALAELRLAVAERARASHRAEGASAHPAGQAVRRLFRQAGCDPTRYRHSSEALLRRILKGEDLPAIHPLVDLNNCLSVELLVPSCVMAVGSAEPPFVLRRGLPGERMLSLRGPFDLEGKPLLADARGPFGTPITDSERVRVSETTARAWLVAYLPEGYVSEECVASALGALLRDAPVAQVEETATTRLAA